MMSTQKILLASATMLLLLAASLAINQAEAKDNAKEPKLRAIKKVNDNNKTFVLGGGIAIEQGEDKPYKSSMKLKFIESNTENTGITVKEGKIVINDEGSPVRYPIIADRWNIELNDSGFSANGYSQDSDGIIYKVSLEGEYLHDTSHGKLYIVEGEFSEDASDGEVYELHYIVLFIDSASQSAKVVSNND